MLAHWPVATRRTLRIYFPIGSILDYEDAHDNSEAERKRRDDGRQPGGFSQGAGAICDWRDRGHHLRWRAPPRHYRQRLFLCLTRPTAHPRLHREDILSTPGDAAQRLLRRECARRESARSEQVLRRTFHRA